MLSIVISTRNDNHAGDPLARCATFMDILTSQVEEFDLSVELIIVDWNPPRDRPRLHEALRKPGRMKARYIIVPHEVHAKIGNSDKLTFFQMWAKNAGIRRAKGDWILATNIDIILSDPMAQFLATSGRDSRYFYRATRYDIGAEAVPPGTRRERLAFCQENVTRVHGAHGVLRAPVSMSLPAVSSHQDEARWIRRKLFTNACGDFQMLSRSAWRRLRGYPELGLYSIHVDTMFMYLARAMGLEQVVLPYPIYHIEHSDGWAVMSVVQQRACVEANPSLDPAWVRAFGQRLLWQGQSVENNPGGWGLENVELEEIQC